MRKLFWIILVTLICSNFAVAAARPAYVLNITGSIGPATQEYIRHSLQLANDKRAALVIIQLNTQGGLAKSMDGITQLIASSPVPIVTYIAPSGAHASGAGTFMAYASPIIVMAPGSVIGPGILNSTNGGIKHFLTLTVIKKNKIHEATQQILALANANHHNVTWAELTVNEEKSLTAEDALKENVINAIANNMDDLLIKINGMISKSRGIPLVINTQNLTLETLKPSWQYYVLKCITNPVCAYIFLLAGIMGIFFEFLRPGKIIPGLLGTLCLIPAFYAFQLLSISFFGLTLVLLGMACMLIEIIRANFGITALLGILGFVLGSALVLDMNAPGYHLPWVFIAIISLASASILFLIFLFTIKKSQSTTPDEYNNMIGMIGEVLEYHADHVMVNVQGKIWSALSTVRLSPGQAVRVTKMTNLILTIEPIISSKN